MQIHSDFSSDVTGKVTSWTISVLAFIFIPSCHSQIFLAFQFNRSTLSEKDVLSCLHISEVFSR